MQAIRYIIFLLFCLVMSRSVNAQGLVIRNYNVKDGLANATVYSAVQDQEGFIWFATPTGASKFDGKRFRNYTKKDGLTDNDVIKLAADARGRIWFFTNNGRLSYYYRHIVHNAENDSSLAYTSRNHFMQYAFQDRALNIWFLNTAGRVLQYNGRQTTYKLGTKPTDVLWLLSQDTIFHPLQDYFHLGSVKDSTNRSQKIFLTPAYPVQDERFGPRIRQNPVVIVGNTLYSFTPQDIIPFFKGAEWGITEEISCMSIEKDNLWIGTPRSLYFIKDFFKGERRINKLLDNHFVTSILNDRDGNIWITTYGDGVYHIPFKNFYFAYLDNTNGLYSHSIYSVLKDRRNGLLYIGANAGMLNIMDPAGHIQRYALDSTGGRNSVLSVLPTPTTKNSVVIATDNAIYEYAPGMRKPREALKLRNIKDLDVSESGTVRVVSRNRVVNGLDGRQIDLSGLETQVSSVACVTDTSYYLGTGNGLYYSEGNHQPIPVQDDPRLGQSIKDLQWIDGFLWIGTSDQGIFVLKNNQVIRHFRMTPDNLVSDICQGLYYDGNSRLYVATNRGVSVIDTRNRVLLRNYTSNDGLMSDDIRGLSHAGDTLFIATSNGLCYFSRDHIPVDTVPPTVYLNAIRYGDSGYLPRAYFQHIYERGSSFEVEFGAIAYDLPDLVEYQYNFSNDTSSGWVTTMSNIVPYPKLLPGDYTLLIRARKYKSDWSRPVALRINILPQWYQEWWARGILVLLALMAILLILRYIINRVKGGEKRKTEYNRRIAELEAKALTNQMNPHFIFNSLNSVQHLILEKEEKQALNFLADFATLMRQMLNNSRKSYISLEDEVAFLTRYLELEKIRFANSFVYKFELSEELKEYTVYIPPMLIQPILENAIKHGLAPKNGSGHLVVRLEMHGDLLYCAVDDDGIGWEHANSMKTGKLTKHESTALSVIKERLQIIKSFNGSVGKLEIIDKFKSGFGNKEGTLVEILIPIVKML